jgi:probable rRNA maturation factor
VNAILGALALSKAEVSILLLDDEGITELNEQYLKKTGPTDVISFPMHDGAFPGVQPQLLGDIAISLETAQRQADRRGVSLHEEVTALLVHGMLHLTGYDHELSPADSRRMKAQERKVLAKVAENC